MSGWQYILLNKTSKTNEWDRNKLSYEKIFSSDKNEKREIDLFKEIHTGQHT